MALSTPILTHMQNLLSLSLSMYTNIYLYIYNIHICIHICIHTYIYILMYMYMMYIFTSVYVYTFIYTDDLQTSFALARQYQRRCLKPSTWPPGLLTRQARDRKIDRWKSWTTRDLIRAIFGIRLDRSNNRFNGWKRGRILGKWSKGNGLGKNSAGKHETQSVGAARCRLKWLKPEKGHIFSRKWVWCHSISILQFSWKVLCS